MTKAKWQCTAWEWRQVDSLGFRPANLDKAAGSRFSKRPLFSESCREQQKIPLEFTHALIGKGIYTHKCTHTCTHRHTEKVVRSGEAGQQVRVFTTQTWMPGFNPQDPMCKKKTGVVVFTWNPSAGVSGDVETGGSLASQTHPVSGLQASERPTLNK